MKRLNYTKQKTFDLQYYFIYSQKNIIPKFLLNTKLNNQFLPWYYNEKMKF